ncbi:threonine aldolase family protein [Apilactobacillus xinyiensis]|uniref:threonine aldolase family protein n=1 Tax=Apilactobacillus xinyiensis TaxID=2841032 RepID=UPI003364EB72
MLSFENDYSEGAHPRILQKLMQTNMQQEPGYGEDSFTAQAKAKIKSAIDNSNASVHFLQGGTQTNQIVIDALLKPYEGVITPDKGHINVHEAGAIEYTGHKLLALPTVNGKLTAAEVRKYLETFYDDDHHDFMVFPGMVYISFPTEYGLLYSKQELTDLHQVCQAYKIPLFIDGARLGYGLMSDEANISFKELAQLCDVFYIGGTKTGALCGEAVVFTSDNEPKHFVTIVKQHGALLAKGRLIGIQFLELFSDNLYFELSKHADEMAKIVKQGFLKKGYRPYLASATNQQFFIVEDTKIAALAKKVKFARWLRYDDTHSVIRFSTCWATTEDSVKELLTLI